MRVGPRRRHDVLCDVCDDPGRFHDLALVRLRNKRRMLPWGHAAFLDNPLHQYKRRPCPVWNLSAKKFLVHKVYFPDVPPNSLSLYAQGDDAIQSTQRESDGISVCLRAGFFRTVVRGPHTTQMDTVAVRLDLNRRLEGRGHCAVIDTRHAH